MNTRGVVRAVILFMVAATVALWSSGCLKKLVQEPVSGTSDIISETPDASEVAGAFIDERDGKRYKTVRMPDGKTWLAENLNHETGESWCRDDDTSNCGKYGRLYEWETALTACPVGWRLPSRRDWGELGRAVGGERKAFGNGTADWYGVGEKLKSKTGWNEHNGTDEYGFSALPSVIASGAAKAGYCQWWTASERGKFAAYDYNIGHNIDNESERDLMEYYLEKSDGHSVRCVQVENARKVTVLSGGAGAKNGGSHAPGDTVAITAGTAPANLRFKKWTSANRDVTFADASNATTAFVMPANDVTVTALFDTVAIAVESGTADDSRDDKTYKTVIIGGKQWTAENMNYETPEGSRCYNDNADSCAKYGRLYTWSAAAGACPVGWRLPDRQDWNDLARAVGGRGGESDDDDKISWYGAGRTLKARSGWNDNIRKSGDGTDGYGFSALPGGYFNSDGFFASAGRLGAWWAATEATGPHNAYGVMMAYHHGYAREDNFFREQGTSVRCVRDTGGAVDEKAEWEHGKEIGRIDAQWRKRAERERMEEEQRIENLSTYFTDSRDGRKYRAVTIGDLNWMAENLLYAPKSGGSWCHHNDTLYCGYGRLYDWKTANTACPSGWRLPSREDWDNLAAAAGGRKENSYDKGMVEWNGVSGKLRSKSGWDPRFPVDWSDKYGFSARPNGSRNPDGTFIRIGLDGQSEWWTATESGGEAIVRWIGYYGHSMRESKAGKSDGYPVRCVADK